MKLAVISSDSTDPFQLSLIGSLAALCAKAGVPVGVLSLNVTLPPLPDLERFLVAWFEHGHFDAYVLLVKPRLHDRDAALVPVVLGALRRLPGVIFGLEHPSLPSVTFDDRQTVREMIHHLYDAHGHRRFLFLLGSETSHEGSERAKAVRWAAAQYPDLVAEYVKGTFQEDLACAHLLQRWSASTDPPPQVIIACEGGVMLGALRALLDLGVTVPSCCAVLGEVDHDSLELQALGLTSLRHEPLAAAQAVLDLLLSPSSRREDFQNHRLVAATLVIGESCGCRQAPAVNFRESLLKATLLYNKNAQARRALTEFSLTVSSAETHEDLVGALTRFARIHETTKLDIGLFETGSNFTQVEVFSSIDSDSASTEALTLTLDDFLGDSGSTSSDSVTAAFFSAEAVQGILVSKCAPRLLPTFCSVVGQILSTARRLRTSEQRLKRIEDLERQSLEKIFACQPLPLLLVGEQTGKIHYLSHQAQKMLCLDGLGPGENALVLKSFEEILKWIEVKNTNEAREFRIVDQSRGLHHVVANGTRLQIHGEPCRFLCALEISEQKKLRKELLSVVEQERKRIGIELHDDISQQIAALSIFARMIKDKVSPGQAAEKMDELLELIGTLQSRVKAISQGQDPKDLGVMTLEEVIGDFLAGIERQTGVGCFFESNSKGRLLGFETQLHLFRIVQEIVQNALKHSQATQLNFSLHETDKELYLHYHDNGVGMKSPQNAVLRSIRRRADQLSGALTVGTSARGSGVALDLCVPKDVSV